MGLTSGSPPKSTQFATDLHPTEGSHQQQVGSSTVNNHSNSELPPLCDSTDCDFVRERGGKPQELKSSQTSFESPLKKKPRDSLEEDGNVWGEPGQAQQGEDRSTNELQQRQQQEEEDQQQNQAREKEQGQQETRNRIPGDDIEEQPPQEEVRQQALSSVESSELAEAIQQVPRSTTGAHQEGVGERVAKRGGEGAGAGERDGGERFNTEHSAAAAAAAVATATAGAPAIDMGLQSLSPASPHEEERAGKKADTRRSFQEAYEAAMAAAGKHRRGVSKVVEQIEEETGVNGNDGSLYGIPQHDAGGHHHMQEQEQQQQQQQEHQGEQEWVQEEEEEGEEEEEEQHEQEEGEEQEEEVWANGDGGVEEGMKSTMPLMSHSTNPFLIHPSNLPGGEEADEEEPRRESENVEHQVNAAAWKAVDMGVQRIAEEEEGDEKGEAGAGADWEEEGEEEGQGYRARAASYDQCHTHHRQHDEEEGGNDPNCTPYHPSSHLFPVHEDLPTPSPDDTSPSPSPTKSSPPLPVRMRASATAAGGNASASLRGSGGGNHIKGGSGAFNPYRSIDSIGSSVDEEIEMEEAPGLIGKPGAVTREASRKGRSPTGGNTAKKGGRGTVAATVNGGKKVRKWMTGSMFGEEDKENVAEKEGVEAVLAGKSQEWREGFEREAEAYLAAAKKVDGSFAQEVSVYRAEVTMDEAGAQGLPEKEAASGAVAGKKPPRNGGPDDRNNAGRKVPGSTNKPLERRESLGGKSDKGSGATDNKTDAAASKKLPAGYEQWLAKRSKAHLPGGTFGSGRKWVGGSSGGADLAGRPGGNRSTSPPVGGDNSAKLSRTMSHNACSSFSSRQQSPPGQDKKAGKWGAEGGRKRSGSPTDLSRSATEKAGSKSTVRNSFSGSPQDLKDHLAAARPWQRKQPLEEKQVGNKKGQQRNVGNHNLRSSREGNVSKQQQEQGMGRARISPPRQQEQEQQKKGVQEQRGQQEQEREGEQKQQQQSKQGGAGMTSETIFDATFLKQLQTQRSNASSLADDNCSLPSTPRSAVSERSSSSHAARDLTTHPHSQSHQSQPQGPPPTQPPPPNSQPPLPPSSHPLPSHFNPNNPFASHYHAPGTHTSNPSVAGGLKPRSSNAVNMPPPTRSSSQRQSNPPPSQPHSSSQPPHLSQAPHSSQPPHSTHHPHSFQPPPLPPSASAFPPNPKPGQQPVYGMPLSFRNYSEANRAPPQLPPDVMVRGGSQHSMPLPSKDASMSGASIQNMPNPSLHNPSMRSYNSSTGSNWYGVHGAEGWISKGNPVSSGVSHPHHPPPPGAGNAHHHPSAGGKPLVTSHSMTGSGGSAGQEAMQQRTVSGRSVSGQSGSDGGGGSRGLEPEDPITRQIREAFLRNQSQVSQAQIHLLI